MQLIKRTTAEFQLAVLISGSIVSVISNTTMTSHTVCCEEDLLCLNMNTSILQCVILSAKVCPKANLWQNAVHYKYVDGAFKTVKQMRVERWKRIALDNHHLGYVTKYLDCSGEQSTIENNVYMCFFFKIY